MAVRTGMTALISELRSRTDVTIAEYSDQQLQDKLDQNKIEFREVALIAAPTYVSGGTNYFIYELPDYVGDWFELPVDNVLNAYFYVTDSARTPVVFGTALDFDADLRRLVFTASTAGVPYILTIQTYDLFGAAADIWQIKCDQASELVDIKTDNHTLALSQSKDSICSKVSYYETRSMRSNDTRIVRVDQALSWNRNKYIRGFVSVDSDWRL